MEFLDFLQAVFDLVPVVGIAAGAITAIVEALKRFSLIPDGWGGIVAGGLNALFWVIQYFAGEAGFLTEFEQLVGVLPALISVLLGVLGSVGLFELFRRR